MTITDRLDVFGGARSIRMRAISGRWEPGISGRKPCLPRVEGPLGREAPERHWGQQPGSLKLAILVCQPAGLEAWPAAV